jgi:hypothetical protein
MSNSLIDTMLTRESDTFYDIQEEQGPMIAESFLYEYNNACIQYAGFEDFEYEAIQAAFTAPPQNLSKLEH